MSAAEGGDGRWHEMLRPPYLLPLITLALGVALFAFNIFFVVTALPTAVTELHGLATITWASSLYLIFAITAGAAAGMAKHRLGARPIFVAAAAVFILGTLLAGLAPSMTVLLTGRVLQGAGAGLVEALSYAMIPVLFPPRLVAKVFGVEAVMWVLAAFGGPAVAGFLTSHWSWRAALLSSVPLALIFVVLVMLIVPREQPDTARIQVPGVRLTLIAAGLLLVTFSSVAQPVTATLLIAAAILSLCSSFILDRRASNRLFPKSAFSLALPFGLGFWVIVLMAVPESSVSVFLPYSIQNNWGYSAFYAGAIHSVLAFSWSFAQIIVATVVSQRIRTELIWVGAGLLAAGLLTASAGVHLKSLPLVILAQTMTGAAFGINWGSISQLLMETAPGDEKVLASALLPTAQSGGFALGASLSGLTGNLLGFADVASPEQTQPIIALVFAVAGVAALPALPLAWIVTRRAKMAS